MKFIEYFPRYCTYGDPATFEFDSVEDLLVKFFKLKGETYDTYLKEDNLIFATDEEGKTLMISSTVENWWWVVGQIKGDEINLLNYFPLYDTCCGRNKKASSLHQDTYNLKTEGSVLEWYPGLVQKFPEIKQLPEKLEVLDILKKYITVSQVEYYRPVVGVEGLPVTGHLLDFCYWLKGSKDLSAEEYTKIKAWLDNKEI